MPIRASAAVAGLLCALPCAHGAGNATFVLGPQIPLNTVLETHGYGHAVDFCTYVGATIATIHSAAENKLARQACGLESCWLGLVYGPTWLWQNPPASQAAAPAYTNWAAGEPANPGASAHAVMMAGEWYGAAADDSAPYPLCRAEGDLNFTLDHNAAQCRERCRPTQGQNKDKKCCAHPQKMSCADDAAGATYQLVRLGTKEKVKGENVDQCDKHNGKPAYSYGCYPRERRRNQKFQSRGGLFPHRCKPGMTCDNGPGDDKKGCPDQDGWVVPVIIVVVIVVVCMCIGGASMAYWVHEYQKNEQQQLGLGWAGQAIAAGATPARRSAVQPYPQPTVVQPYAQPTVVQPVVQLTVFQGAVVTGAVVQGAVVQGSVVQGAVVGSQPIY